MKRQGFARQNRQTILLVMENREALARKSGRAQAPCSFKIDEAMIARGVADPCAIVHNPVGAGCAQRGVRLGGAKGDHTRAGGLACANSRRGILDHDAIARREPSVAAPLA